MTKPLRLQPVLGSLSRSLPDAADGEPGFDGATAEGACKAEPGQAFIGQKATAETGAEAAEGDRARRSLRWVPPRTAVTMDFRPDRLTVSYDDDMVIERVSCT